MFNIIKNLTNLFSETVSFLYYLNRKNFVKKYKENPKNYDRGILLANSKYCDAVADVSVYESLKKLENSSLNIVSSKGKINLETGKKTSLERI